MSIHLTITGGYDHHGTIHVRSTSDHVLDVVCVTWTIDVGVVSSIGLVFNVGTGDGDPALALLRGLVDRTIFKVLRKSLFC
jgi:hypothetical protein